MAQEIFKSPLEAANQTFQLKPRDDAFTQKMNDFHAKRKALLDSKDPNAYLGPEWNALSKEIQNFRSGYEPAKIYSPREYLLDNDIDEFQIDRVRDDISLDDLYDSLQKGEDFYKAASVDGEGFDSAVREKLFDAISRRKGVDYDDIYNAWLGRKTEKKAPYVSKLAVKDPEKYKSIKSQGSYDDETIDLIAQMFGVKFD